MTCDRAFSSTYGLHLLCGDEAQFHALSHFRSKIVAHLMQLSLPNKFKISFYFFDWRFIAYSEKDLVFIKTLDDILDFNLVSSLAFNKKAIWFHCL